MNIAMTTIITRPRNKKYSHNTNNITVNSVLSSI